MYLLTAGRYWEHRATGGREEGLGLEPPAPSACSHRATYSRGGDILIACPEARNILLFFKTIFSFLIFRDLILSHI